MMALAGWLWDTAFAPFAEFAFMRRALVATLALSLSAAPLGVFLTLRRMSLLGDALSHAVLPGVAIGFMLSGLSLTAMAFGGVVAGMLVAGIAGLVTRFTTLKEDASLAAIYLVALALGVMLISGHGTQLDLLHILFGSALGFLMLVVINLVAGFRTLGTLMAVGLMMLPAVSSRLWHDTLPAQLVNASVQAMLASAAGLLLSYHLDTPSGPTIIACAGALYALSLLFAPGGWLPRVLGTPHRVA